MSLWTIIIPLAAIVVPIINDFYKRFYPDVETQKRHLRTAANWTISLVSICASVWILVDLYRQPLPTSGKQTANIAVKASLAIGAILYVTVSQLLFRLIVVLERHVQASKDHAGFTADLLQAVGAHHEALVILATADGLTKEQQGTLKKILLAVGENQKHN